MTQKLEKHFKITANFMYTHTHTHTHMFKGNIYIIQREKQLIIFTFLKSDYSFFRQWQFNPVPGKQTFSIQFWQS
jgi:hypothetical protein